MNLTHQGIAFYSILDKELRRIFRIWPQTLLPPAINTVLYFLVFGQWLGGQIQNIEGYHYIQYAIPGIVLMAALNNAFLGTAFGFFIRKFQRSHEELIVAPVASLTIVISYISAGTFSGILMGSMTLLLSAFFASLPYAHFGLMLFCLVVTAAIFATLGLINALLVKTFDGLSTISAFILTPLSFLGGVFYPTNHLSPLWQMILALNPLAYLINIFRYSLLNISQLPITGTLLGMIITWMLLSLTAWILIKRGMGLKN